jgi:Co/Zn/Cd efflux system component
LWRTAWPDLIVGLAIAAINADTAREVWSAAAEQPGTGGEHPKAAVGVTHGKRDERDLPV